jgi:hypothetical protein
VHIRVSATTLALYASTLATLALSHRFVLDTPPLWPPSFEQALFEAFLQHPALSGETFSGLLLDQWTTHLARPTRTAFLAPQAFYTPAFYEPLLAHSPSAAVILERPSHALYEQDVTQIRRWDSARLTLELHSGF